MESRLSRRRLFGLFAVAPLATHRCIEGVTRGDPGPYRQELLPEPGKAFEAMTADLQALPPPLALLFAPGDHVFNGVPIRQVESPDANG